MSRIVRLATPILAGLALAAVAVSVGGVMADDKAPAAKAQVKTLTLRAVAPGKGRLITGAAKLTTGGGLETVCCTNWNTSTGGTGCASFEGECPSGQFKVECKADGCW